VNSRLKNLVPAQIARLEKQSVVAVACNSGSSCLLNKKGELFIYGKDTTFADLLTGKVNDLSGQTITAVAIGKAHIVALSAAQEVFTFGVNNKGQCGREFPTFAAASAAGSRIEQAAEAAAAGGGDEVSDHEGEIDVEALGKFLVIFLSKVLGHEK
jgi:E3 ubiquitin-protein ligase MYCBP2